LQEEGKSLRVTFVEDSGRSRGSCYLSEDGLLGPFGEKPQIFRVASPVRVVFYLGFL
jgi:hypothetical protein